MSSRVKPKKAVLVADREAPLGWAYLKIYEDKSFEFISKGLRDQNSLNKSAYNMGFAAMHSTDNVFELDRGYTINETGS